MNEQENEALSSLPIENRGNSQDLPSQTQDDIDLSVAEVEDGSASLRGTLIDFLDHIRGGFQSPAESVKSSSTIEEIQEQQAQLKYRRAWLQAILNETDREIEIITQIIESKE